MSSSRGSGLTSLIKTGEGGGTRSRNYRTCGPKLGFQIGPLSVQWKNGEFHISYPSIYYNNEKHSLQCTYNFILLGQLNRDKIYMLKICFWFCVSLSRVYYDFVKHMDFQYLMKFLLLQCKYQWNLVFTVHLTGFKNVTLGATSLVGHFPWK